MGSQAPAPRESRKSYCRVCHNYCALEVDLEDGRAVAVRGDAADPIYGGYTCIKGRQLPELLRHPARILRPQRRRPDAGFDEVPLGQALDEISERVGSIVAEHGPRAVASYCGTHAFQNSAALAVAKAWHAGLGSESFYSSITIDQPAKFIAMSRIGVWSAGLHGFESADVVMVIGNNPIVSQYAPIGGIPPWSPVKSLNEAKRRGLKLICIDPRTTDVARRADLHLAVRPGEDPSLLTPCGMPARASTSSWWRRAPGCRAKRSSPRLACSRAGRAASPPPEPGRTWRLIPTSRSTWCRP